MVTMPPSAESARKGTRRFETLWTLPGPRPISPIVTSVLLREVNSAVKCDSVERDTRPPYLGSADLKYKL
jgi:hypothetical protein